MNANVGAEAERLQLAEHRARRVAEATGPRGAASFVWGKMVARPGTTVDGAPGSWGPDPLGRPALEVAASAEERISIGGALVDGTATLFYDASDGPTLAAFPDGAAGVLFTYNGKRFALQVWNPQSEWARSFSGILSWDYNPELIVPASVTLIDSERTVAMSHHRDPRPVDVPVIAEVQFSLEGREHTLLATSRGPGHDGMAILLKDATNGSESYSAGRALVIPEVREGPIVLDFNYAELLPCAFSLAWNCPIPPVENILPIAVRAGERYAQTSSGMQML